MVTRVSRSTEIKFSLFALAATTLVAGYADLARGGITLSAVLLSLAYCAFIPLAIWSGAHGDSANEPGDSPVVRNRRAGGARGVGLVSADDGAVDGDVGHERVHRGGLHLRAAAPARQSVLRHHRPCVLAPADRADRRGARQRVRRGLQCRRRRRVVSRRRARGASMAARTMAADRRWRACRADRRDGVHRVESVGGEREGLHGFARRNRARLVARRTLVRPGRRSARRPRARDDRVPVRAWLRQPHGGHARRRRRLLRSSFCDVRQHCSGGSCCSRV